MVEAVKERMLRNGEISHKDSLGPVGPSAAFAPEDPQDQVKDDVDEDERTPALPPTSPSFPPVLPPALPSIVGEPETPTWKYDARMDVVQ